jgi:hypothetical protein
MYSSLYNEASGDNKRSGSFKEGGETAQFHSLPVGRLDGTKNPGIQKSANL